MAHLSVALICISLRTVEMDCLFMCLLVMSGFSLCANLGPVLRT